MVRNEKTAYKAYQLASFPIFAHDKRNEILPQKLFS